MGIKYMIIDVFGFVYGVHASPGGCFRRDAYLD
jgi:hypothetical protein